MDSLASKGVIVIYIGQPFTYDAQWQPFGTDAGQDTLNSLPVSFDESADHHFDPDFHLKQPLYRASATRRMDRQHGLWLRQHAGPRATGRSFSCRRRWIPAGTTHGRRRRYLHDSLRHPVVRPIGDPRTTCSRTRRNIQAAQLLLHQHVHSCERYDQSGIHRLSAGLGAIPCARPSCSCRIDDKNASVVEQSGQVIPYNVTGQPTRMNARLREPIAAQPNMFLNIYRCQWHRGPESPRR